MRAWNSLSPDAQQQYAEQFATLFRKIQGQNPGTLEPPLKRNARLTFRDALGIQKTVQANAKGDNRFGISNDLRNPFSTFRKAGKKVEGGSRPNWGVDLDVDGLDDEFEDSLADGFSPYYFVSAGEQSGTGFADFYDSVPQTVSQTFGSTPPRSHYRVKPLRQEYRNGVLYGLIELDYFTLWNRDDGLLIGYPCTVFSLTLGVSLTGLFSHSLDNEYSSVLVAAPVTAQGDYDPNIANYSAYGLYAAAHENTFNDQSVKILFSSPIPYDSHLFLALSQSKHATYTYSPGQFYPNYNPLFPEAFIISVYDAIFLAYFLANDDPFLLAIYLYIADTFFFFCIVDHFTDQGGAFAEYPRMNIGEPNHANSGFSFIDDTELHSKLTSTTRPNW